MGKGTFSVKTLLFIPSILPKIYLEKSFLALFHKGFYIYLVYSEGSMSDLTRNKKSGAMMQRYDPACLKMG